MLPDDLQQTKLNPGTQIHTDSTLFNPNVYLIEKQIGREIALHVT